MKYILIESLLLVIALIIQVIIWRIKVPERQTKCIIFINISVLMIFILFVYFFQLQNFFISNIYIFNFIIFHLITLMSYLITFSAIEADSPSLLILYLIYLKKTDGLLLEELYKILNDQVLIHTRINDLYAGNMAYKSNDRISLTSKGKFMAFMFYQYRKLLKLQNYGG